MEYKLDDALSELGFTLRGDGSFKSGCEIVFSLTQGEDEAGNPNEEIFYRVEVCTSKGTLFFIVHEADFIVGKGGPLGGEADHGPTLA
jgi:hypothetical protein